MEEQHTGDPLTDPASSLSSSELTLRFPRPQGNRHLASWISSSEPDIMNPSNTPDDISEPMEASYEFINTDDDGESQDDRGTEAEAESLSSFDYARPDDVHSLDGNERTDDTASRSAMYTDDEEEDEDDDDDAEDKSRASSIQYAEQSLMSPSSQGTILPPLLDNTGDNLEAQSPIPLEESQGKIALRQVSVKHATHTFDSAQSAEFIRAVGSKVQPNSRTPMFATIRLTMAPSCVDTDLRVLYVGCPEAQAEVIAKLTSVMGKTELSVEVCSEAVQTIHRGENFPDETVYSITIDNNRIFQSTFTPGGSFIEPTWDLPHLAIVFVTENDDETTRKTREAALGFMERHAVPRIFISNTELFQHPTKNWSDLINQHVIHRCVESSDRAFPSVKLPIDLKSFKETDSRQLNRNLAYLTGLYQAVDEPEVSGFFSPVYASAMKSLSVIKQHTFEGWENVDWWNAVHSIGVCLFVVTVAMLGNLYLGGSSAPALPTVSTTASSSAPGVSATSVSVSTSTITINLTSTKTIQVPQGKTLQSNTAVAPFAELADFFADKFPESQKTYICSAEKFGRYEILVKIPSSTKTSWLAKDSITIDVLKGDRAVKTKFSSIDEGILIEIPKKEAHGLLTVAINTTRKPRVNETFTVDFGKTGLDHCLGLSNFVAKQVASLAKNVAQRGAEHAVALGEDVREVSARISTEAATTAEYVSGSLAKTLQDVRQSPKAQDALDWVHIKHKKAQIHSWLLWLRIQRRMEEHDNYLEKARKYLSEKKLAVEMGNKARLGKQRMEQRARRKTERLEARCQSGFSRWTQQCKRQG
ncbi:hypothetical protein CMUS01_07018 [Colletotrichum musicola]|uniref:Uncharacterized protein n=1 Tax=Colletotrichum musicola TaxID=2175873 RepID=A0A8H6KJK5_9PEZI|nr:hypothetical protein CMUS01_07018 [Colletotrichum musicola]